MTKKSSIISLILIITCCIFLIIYQSKNDRILPKFYFSQLLNPLILIKDSIKDFFLLKQENAQLKKQIFELSLRENYYSSLIQENKRLKEILTLKEQRKDIVAIGKVISKGSTKYLKTIWIDKGSEHGIKKDYSALTPNGLVGKVVSVYPESSEILLITDPNFSVSVRIQRSRTEGVLNGKGDNCIIKYIPLEEEVLVGDRVITSGLDGIFPEGIIIGAVKSTDKRNGLFQIIEVIPMQPDNKIEEVAIVKREK